MSLHLRSGKVMRDNDWPLVTVARNGNLIFDVFDVVGVDTFGVTVGVVAVPDEDVTATLYRLRRDERVGELLRSGWAIAVHGWAKEKGRWYVQETELTEWGPVP